jgi:tripartite-type tricarboxylate transporter receptor subunit TctC
LPFDYEAFTLLGTYATITPVVIGATKTSRPFKTIEEVLSFAKSHPDEISIATAAIGQNWWIAAMAFQAGTGLKFNMILQPGTGAYVIAQVAGGHTDLGVTGLASPRAQVEAGNARLLAIFGSKRAPAPYDHIPNFKELGYDIRWEAVQGVMGPAKMPKEITQKLAGAFETAANEPEFRKFVAEQNCMPFYLGPDQFFRYLSEQRNVCRSIMEKAGILKEK